MKAAGRLSGVEEYGFREEKAEWISVDEKFLRGRDGVLFCLLAATEFLIS